MMDEAGWEGFDSLEIDEDALADFALPSVAQQANSTPNNFRAPFGAQPEYDANTADNTLPSFLAPVVSSEQPAVSAYRHRSVAASQQHPIVVAQHPSDVTIQQPPIVASQQPPVVAQQLTVVAFQQPAVGASQQPAVAQHHSRQHLDVYHRSRSPVRSQVATASSLPSPGRRSTGGWSGEAGRHDSSVNSPSARELVSTVRQPGKNLQSSSGRRSNELDASRLLGDDDAESDLERKCQLEGPPGPAGAARAILNADRSELGSAAKGPRLFECVSWLAALRGLGLPWDHAHLGAGGSLSSAGDARLASNNLSTISRHVHEHPSRRWCALVFIRSVEMLAGEVETVVCDPTGEMGASVDRRLLHSQPKAICEGATLLLEGIVALMPVHGASCRLLITERTVSKVFVPTDVAASQASCLFADARAVLGGA